MPRKPTFKVIGLPGVSLAINRGRDKAYAQIRESTSRNGGLVKSMARRLCAYRTGRMRSSITMELIDNELRFKVFYDPEVFSRDNEPYYAPYVELGTRFMSAQPALFPAYKAYEKSYTNEVKQILKRAWAGTI